MRRTSLFREFLAAACWLVLCTPGHAVCPQGSYYVNGFCSSLSDTEINTIDKAIDRSAEISGAKPDVRAVLKTLDTKSYEELYAIKLSDPAAVCELARCDHMSGATVSKLADAILSAREKEKGDATAKTTNTIAISGAIIAILTFILSAFNAVVALRTKKT
jgi:hypothetical protein